MLGVRDRIGGPGFILQACLSSFGWSPKAELMVRLELGTELTEKDIVFSLCALLFSGENLSLSFFGDPSL